jgi:DNA-binding response OmpR family regulator
MTYKLIVADSSPSIQKVIQMAFSGSEFDIYTFDDGLEVMTSLSQINPDVVLLNLSLPRKDGRDIAFYIRSHDEFKNTLLILLIGAFDRLEKEKIADLDYDEIIQEPFDSERLLQLVKELIERKRDPQTFPEEPVLERIIAGEETFDIEKESSQRNIHAQNETHEEKKCPSTLDSDQIVEIEEIVKNLMRGEILDIERELEKRIQAKALPELKQLIWKELKEIRKQLEEKS